MESWSKLTQKIRVPAGTVLGVVFLILMDPSRRSLWIGGILAVGGAALRIWAAGYIEKGRVLAQDGPYAWTRNPLYLGSFLIAFGVLVAGQGFWLLIPFVLFFLAVYYPVMKAEEQELFRGHGEEFRAYAGRVPLFFPSLRAAAGRPSGFLWSRVIQNREHRAILGLLLTEAILILHYMV